MNKLIRKIVILGPESTGKSTLCSQLAAHYGTIWCEEYARAYLLQHGTNYHFEQLLDIAKGQLALEDAAIEHLQQPEGRTDFPYLFIDTDMHVMKVWCEYVFGKCHPFIEGQIVLRQYDLYLLCNTDLPWVKDELREYPDKANRKELFNIYHQLLTRQSTPWAIISGNDEARLQLAIATIDQYFGSLNGGR